MFKRMIALLAAALVLAAFVPVASAQGYCYGALEPRLRVGEQGRVTPGLPNILRSQPYRGYDSIVLGEIPAGGVFNVVGGPNCFDGMYWWQVEYNGMYGWTPEGSSYGVYWTEPYYTGGNCMNLPSRLYAGGGGYVSPGLPNVLRSEPNQGQTSQVITTMPAGSGFAVRFGPSCSNGMTWWEVEYNGLIGWTPEGQGNVYWLEPAGIVPPTPVGCYDVSMYPTMTGMVRAGLPNRLRAQPSVNSNILATMDAGETFIVVSGPSCADGIAWWQVNYRGTVGWTAGQQNGQQWIEPVTCAGFQTSRLAVGRVGRVTPGLPNRIRSSSSTSSAVRGLIPAGASFSVIGGPVCSENSAWWRVNYRGVIGWTMEGQYGQYWLELVP